MVGDTFTEQIEFIGNGVFLPFFPKSSGANFRRSTVSDYKSKISIVRPIQMTRKAL
jgi:Kef-type K+ transport system membrane component KefB